MILSKYGILLKRLTEDKIEMVRNWRNDPKISRYMEFRDIISSEMQKKWFERINNDLNYYFIIEYNGQEIGVNNVRDINYEKLEGESGIFIYDDEYLNSDLAFRATLCMNDYFFEEMNFNRTTGRVLRNNKRAIRFNKVLGAVPLPDQDHLENQFWETKRENYFICRSNLLKLLKL